MKEALRLDGEDCSNLSFVPTGQKLNDSAIQHKEFRDKPLKIVKSHKSAGALAVSLPL